jgi:hypothetical protein
VHHPCRDVEFFMNRVRVVGQDGGQMRENRPGPIDFQVTRFAESPQCGSSEGDIVCRPLGAPADGNEIPPAGNQSCARAESPLECF